MLIEINEDTYKYVKIELTKILYQYDIREDLQLAEEARFNRDILMQDLISRKIEYPKKNEMFTEKS